MKKNYYAWVICILCCVTMACMALATSVYAVYQPFIIQQNGLTNAQGSALITVRAAVGTVAMLFVNKIIQKIGVKADIALAVASSVLGFAVYGLATLTHSYPLYCTGAALQGIAYGIGSLIPVTILINRWFVSHRALALGIAGAGTGLASFVAPPLITQAIVNLSLHTAFFLEAAVMLVMCVLLFVFLRNDPSQKGLQPYEAGERKREKTVKAPVQRITGELGIFNLILMLVASFLIGCVTSPGYSHISVLYTNEGFAPDVVALLMSVLGIMIVLGKLLYGAVVDRIGTYRSGYLFFTLYVAGVALCCLAAVQSTVLGFTAMVILGIGYPIATVGLPLFGLDMAATPERAGKRVKHFQLAYMVGALAFSSVPGIMADAQNGSYIMAFAVMAAILAVAMAITQASYARLARKNKAAKAAAAAEDIEVA